MAKFDPFHSLDYARVEGMGAQSKERKGSNFAAKCSGAIVKKPEGPNSTIKKSGYSHLATMSLHAVGDQPRLEAAAKEADEPVLLDDVAHHVGVGDHVRERLPRRLDHPGSGDSALG